jgi:hypothetical protein
MGSLFFFRREMKHKFVDDVNINIDIPTEDLEDLIDKVTESAVIVIGALTVSHILKRLIR